MPQYYICRLILLTWMYSNGVESNNLILQGFIPIIMMGINYINFNDGLTRLVFL